MNNKKLITIICAVLVLVLCLVALFIPKPNKNQNVPPSPKVEQSEFAIDPVKAKLCANASNPAKGYCETQADQLRGEILNAKNTEELYEINGTKYYVSSSEGDDNNDGLTPETPIKTLQKMKELYTIEGDAFLFKRGDTFRFGETIKARKGVTYGSYGEGAKPKIYGSPENYAESDKWENYKENIWKIPFDYNEACGLVINHSEIVGIKKLTTALSTNGEYFHDTESSIFYLFCDKGKPSEVYEDIEIMPSTNIFTIKGAKRDITIDNLCLKYTAAFAIHATDVINFNVTNCEIGFTGGKWANKETGLRYGNAVELWGGANNAKVETNWIYQTYDSALTWQGRSGGTYKDVSFSNNLFEYNNADIEFFDRNGSHVENFRMDNNIMRFTSMGWGTRKSDGGIRGIEGCVRAVTCSRREATAVDIKSVYFTNNTIDCPARQTINWNIDPDQRKFIHAKGTKLYIKSSYRTLSTCLQGLQTDSNQPYDRRFAETYEELKEGFKLFEKGAEIHWDE